MHQDNPNEMTLRSYRARVNEYCEGTSQEVSENLGRWLNSAVAGLPLDSRILEIGSGHGRDAAYLEAKGYKVECSDAVPGFVEHLEARGLNARQLNILTDSIGGTYRLVLAVAVLLHFTSTDVKRVIAKAHEALEPNGRFAFCVKAGDGEEWSHAKIGLPRYFHYWSANRLQQILGRSGFSRYDLVEQPLDERQEGWLCVCAHKG